MRRQQKRVFLLEIINFCGFFAHEIGHFWNSNLAHYNNPDNEDDIGQIGKINYPKDKDKNNIYELMVSVKDSYVRSIQTITVEVIQFRSI